MASKFVIYGVLLVVACFVFEVNADEDEEDIGAFEKRLSSVNPIIKFLGIGGPFRGIGIAVGVFLAFTGMLLNFVGFIGGKFANGLGNFLGTAGHLIGILANGIATLGQSNLQFIDAIKAATL